MPTIPLICVLPSFSFLLSSPFEKLPVFISWGIWNFIQPCNNHIHVLKSGSSLKGLFPVLSAEALDELEEPVEVDVGRPDAGGSVDRGAPVVHVLQET